MKPGYKQTEVGVIPEDWDTRLCSALSNLITVGIVIRPTQYYVKQGVPALRSANVREDGIDDADMVFISKKANDLLAKSQVREGDVLTVRTGYPGTSAVVPPSFTGANCIDILITRPSSAVSPEFLAAWINSSFGKSQVLRNQGGLAQQHFNVRDLRNLLVALPPTKSEQEAIAEALSDADSLIESLKQLLVKKRQLKQGAMQELLTGKKRLPGFSGAWEVKRLGEIAHIKTGSRNNEDKIEDGEYPFFVRSENVERINSYSHDCEAILVPGEGRIGDIFHYINGRFDVHQRVYAITQFRPGMSAKFVHLYMTMNFGAWAMQNTVKATVDSLRLPTFQTFEMEMPPTEDEQTAIAAILSDMDAEIGALEAKLAKARSLKQGMMQELLTGRIRLVQPAASIVSLPRQEKTSPAARKSHNWQINEAVIIGVLARNFGTEQWPLARKRCTKLTYLLHRHAEGRAEGYLKKAAGPYNPATRYKGPEGIAHKNGYVRTHHNGTYPGFVAAGNVAEAEAYFAEWYGSEVLAWLERFRLKKTDELELLATVDMAMEDLRRTGKAVTMDAVKQVIRDHPEWQAKLDRPIFSDANITRAIAECRALFWG